ncbi:hypothetical protein JCM10908_000423 [Rhodotorula pacifica]|uniref:uncharacterized protein n=1 Tax=Rhodotorula pacifica TaxID=1495444 RepID=UPI00317788CD
MDNFSSADSLRALCAPFCCCFSQRRLALSSSTESLNQLQQAYTGDAQSSEAPEGTEGHGDDLAAYEARVAGGTAGPAWGQQGGMHLASNLLPRTPRNRQQRRGGDISGGGTDTGSGLTRWTLLRSWLRGGQGAIQLPDSEDEAENLTNSRSSSSNRFLGRTYGDEDAAPIALDDVSLPPAPPSPFVVEAAPSSRSSGGAPSSDQTTSDGRSTLDVDETAEREERRRRRRIRRQAREVGLTPEEYEAQIDSGLLMVEAAQPVQDAARTPREERHETRSQASTESSGSRRRRKALDHAVIAAAPSTADGTHLEVATASSSSSGRRAHQSQLSTSSSHSTTVSSSSSSKRSDRHHRRRRKDKAENAYPDAPPRSPLETRSDEYFEDEHGQLHAQEQGEEDQHLAAAEEGATVSYDHIGVLPSSPLLVADES